MDAEAVKHLGGICQLLGVTLVFQEVLAFARYRGELAKAEAWLHARAATAMASLRRLLRRPRQVVLADAGTAGVSLTAHGATVSTGMVGPFIPPPGQTLQEQVAALGLLVNQLRERVVAEPQERQRAIAAERAGAVPGRRTGLPGLGVHRGPSPGHRLAPAGRASATRFDPS